MSSQQDDGKDIRANAEQLLQRVEKRELLLSLSPGGTKEFLTPQQQEELRKLSIQHDKDERKNAELSLRRHGYVPKIQRRRVVVGGKVYVEDIEGESDGDDDSSFVSCLGVEDQIFDTNKPSQEGNNASREGKDEWIHLPVFEDQQSNVDDDCDWEPLVPRDTDNSTLDTKLPANESSQKSNNLASQPNGSDPIPRKSSVGLTDAAKDDTTNNEIIQHDESNSNEGDNPLLWIGGGLAFAGAVAGLAFANIKKKEHYEKKSRGSPK